MWARSLGWEDPLEEGMATHSSILPWRIPWAEESGGLWSIGSDRAEAGLSTHLPSHLGTSTEIWQWSER